MKAYFAHSMKSYNTRDEQNCITYLEKLGHDVINPRDFTLPTNHASHNGMAIMRYCLQKLKQCDIIICREYKGKVGKGVFDEICCAKK